MDAAAPATDRPSPAALLGVALIGVLASARLAQLALARYDWFFAGWDVAIYDQMMWLLSRGHGTWLTVRGLYAFGHHLNLVALALVPLYRLAPGPVTLLTVQTVAVALAAVPAFCLARRLSGHDGVGLCWAFVAVSYPAAQFMAVWEFHFDPLTYPLALAALACVAAGRWRAFAGWMVATLLIKEPSGLCLAALGVGLALTGERRRGGWCVVVGLGWTLLAMKVVMPWLSHGTRDAFYLTYFSRFGSGPIALLVAPLARPAAFWGALLTAENGRLVLNLLVPLGCLCLAKPSWLLGALPILLFNMIGVEGGLLGGLRQIHHHFHALAVPFLVGAAIAGGAEVSRRAQAAGMRADVARAVPLVLVAVGCWVLPAVAPKLLEPAPTSRRQLRGELWAMRQLHPWAARAHALAARIPAGDSVAASHATVTRVCGRQRVYLYPELFPPDQPMTLGAQPGPDTAADLRRRLATLGVDWFLLETRSTNALTNAGLAALREDRRYELVEDVGGVGLWRRRK